MVSDGVGPALRRWPVAEFADRELEAEYRRYEIEQLGRSRSVGIGVSLILLIVLAGFGLDVSTFTGERGDLLSATIILRLCGVVVMAGMLVLAARARHPRAHYLWMIGFHTALAALYATVAQTYELHAGGSQNQLIFAAFMMIVIAVSAAPVRWGVLAGLPYLVAALVLHSVMLPNGAPLLTGVTTLMAGVAGTLALVTLNRSGRAAFSLERRLTNANAQLQNEVERRSEAEAELRAHHQQLEEMVADRTTELVASERRSLALEEQLLQAQKLEAIGHLASGVAHDFGNTLVPIMACADMLREDLAPESSLRVDVEQIIDAATRARDLVHQLLAVGRAQPLQIGILDLDELVRGQRSILARLLPADVELELQLAAGDGRIRADAGQLEQVLLNLTLNAKDALPGAGAFTIRTETVEVAAGKAEPGVEGALAPGDYLLLEVSDTGHGMDAAVIRRVCEPFFTTKQEGRGSGLGLAMVQGIVAQHGGALGIVSEVGRGTTFRIFMPLVVGTVTARSPRKPVAPETTGGETVLVADDDAIVLRATGRMLERSGYKVLVAADGDRAIEVAKSHDGQIDLLLADMIMPGKRGPQVADEVRRLHPEVRVVFTSGYTEQVLDAGGRKGPCAVFLPKPYNRAVLLEKVRAALEDPMARVG